MRAVVQRVQTANVIIQNDSTHPYEKGRIEQGFMVLLGVSDEDQMSDVTYIADKLAVLRVFEDENGKMNQSIQDVQGEILLVSQFTLYGDCRKGRRPSFIKAARPDKAIPLYEATIQALINKGITVKTGEFGADMAVNLTNDGPVTLLLDSSKAW